MILEVKDLNDAITFTVMDEEDIGSDR